MTQILIVEDEQNLARFLELELTHENYNVDTEYDGQDGLDKALSHYYDLIILDLMLPSIQEILLSFVHLLLLKFQSFV
ncbi:response regulator ArlR [Staphylococcus aureus T16615]|nr:response regulator ArlR [Staphylococcus aureus T16615]